jgi:hypothetical protein
MASLGDVPHRRIRRRNGKTTIGFLGFTARRRDCSRAGDSCLPGARAIWPKRAAAAASQRPGQRACPGAGTAWAAGTDAARRNGRRRPAASAAHTTSGGCCSAATGYCRCTAGIHHPRSRSFSTAGAATWRGCCPVGTARTGGRAATRSISAAAARRAASAQRTATGRNRH